jgi:predicted ATPase
MTELTQHQQAAELPLDYLSAEDVTAYCAQRWQGDARWEAVAHVLHQRTRGHPLFLVTLLDEMRRLGLLHEAAAGGEVATAVEALRHAVPASLRHIIEQQLHQVCPEDQGLLEAASLAGRAFSAAAVAAAVTQATEAVEARLSVLAHRGQFIAPCGLVEWPDGTVAAGYSFRHDLYREILYDRVPPSRQQRWHLQIGLRKERGYGAQARQMAAELAVHFARGHDAWRAVTYLQYAGENALQRSAYQEAIPQLTTGLEVLATVPETPAPPAARAGAPARPYPGVAGHQRPCGARARTGPHPRLHPGSAGGGDPAVWRGAAESVVVPLPASRVPGGADAGSARP